MKSENEEHFEHYLKQFRFDPPDSLLTEILGSYRNRRFIRYIVFGSVAASFLVITTLISIFYFAPQNDVPEKNNETIISRTIRWGDVHAMVLNQEKSLEDVLGKTSAKVLPRYNILDRNFCERGYKN